jgi:hypothetical protein
MGLGDVRMVNDPGAKLELKKLFGIVRYAHISDAGKSEWNSSRKIQYDIYA